MPLSQLPEFLPILLVEFLPFEDATCLAVASVSTLCNLEVANGILSSTGLSGMELLGWRPFRGALFQQLRESIQPQTLVDVKCCECDPLYGTLAMPLSLETSGTYFVRFLFWCSSKNGCPSMGVVDAAEVRRDPLAKLSEDASRPRQSSETFGISCDPYTGKIHASCTSNPPDHVLGDLPEQGVSSQRSWTNGVVGWESWEEAATDSDGFSMGCGMLISNGTLEFIRQGPDAWERSGVVWDQLPAKVACCAFLFSFVGEACVTLEELLVNELPSCTQMQSTVRGKVSSWIAWPPA